MTGHLSPSAASVIVGSPGSLRALANSWSLAAAVDSAAVTDVLTAAVKTSAAMPGAENTQALCAAVSAPSGSLEAAGRLLTSVCHALGTYATALETEQRLWAEAASAEKQATVALQEAKADFVARSLGVVPTDLGSLADLVSLRPPPDLSAMERLQAIARADQATAVNNATTATMTVLVELTTFAGELELLQQRSVQGGSTPSSLPAVPPLGGVPAGPSYDATVAPAQLPHWSDPVRTAEWFHGLSATEQRSLIATQPDFVGQADGIPAWARDQANRTLLARDLDEQDRALGALGLDRTAVDTEEEAEQVGLQLMALGWSDAEIATALGVWSVDRQLRRAQDSAPDRSAQLYIYEPAAYDGDGRAAISLGDLDSATNVGVLVPGMTSDVPSYLDGHVSAGIAAADDAARQGLDTAYLAYVGYDAPGVEPGVMFQAMADRGAAQLASDLMGFRASRGADQAFFSAVAHSFGGVTTSTAVAEHGLVLDALLLVQAPGAGAAETVADYPGMDPSRVYVLSESDDPVPALGQFAGTLGPDPASADFGATRLRAESDAVLFGAHSAMFTPGGWSLYNITRVTGNQLDQVRTAPRRISLPSVPGVPNVVSSIDPEWLTPKTIPGTPVPGPDTRPDPAPATPLPDPVRTVPDSIVGTPVPGPIPASPGPIAGTPQPGPIPGVPPLGPDPVPAPPEPGVLGPVPMPEAHPVPRPEVPPASMPQVRPLPESNLAPVPMPEVQVIPRARE